MTGVSDGLAVRYPAWPGETAEQLLGALREAGVRLAEVPIRDLVDCIGRVADRFLDSSDPLRQHAIDLLVPTAAISEEMASEILTGMARDWTADRLTELLRRELRDPGVLDGFCRVDEGRRVRAKGPLLTFHVGAGTVPGVSVTSMIRALLVKSATLLPNTALSRECSATDVPFHIRTPDVSKPHVARGAVSGFVTRSAPRPPGWRPRPWCPNIGSR